MHAAALGPLYEALVDFHRGDDRATVVIWRDDGLAEALPASYFFREERNFSALERAALDLCRGRVLTLDADAGAHSLALQSQGHKVSCLTPTDAIRRLLAERGLLAPLCKHLDDVDDAPYDTLLRLAPGVGLAEDLRGLHRFLDACRSLVGPGGRLVLNSRDLIRAQPLYYMYGLLNQNAGRYSGEVRLHLEYRGRRGEAFRWIHVDAATLAEYAAAAGWQTSIAAEDQQGNYVAVLVPL